MAEPDASWAPLRILPAASHLLRIVSSNDSGSTEVSRVVDEEELAAVNDNMLVVREKTARVAFGPNKKPYGRKNAFSEN